MSLSFLMLQGTASPFFCRLAAALHINGHTAERVNFCGGDHVYGGGEPTDEYREAPAHLADWYRHKLAQKTYTDILLFGDCRAVHQPVHALARAQGVRVHVFEEGYIRPFWLTLERHGVNGRSQMPRDPRFYLGARSRIPYEGPAVPTGYNLYERAWHDMRYRSANALYAWRYPLYRSHRPHNGWLEYTALAKRFAQKKHHDIESEEVIRKLVATKAAYYLFPLQLNSDTQIIHHSPFNNMGEAMSMVIESFARHAPADALLVIKNHPLDTGLNHYHDLARQLCEHHGVAQRLRYIEAGHQPTLLEHARGVVVVNSTLGLGAVHHRCPTITLGKAIYDMEGLTFQGKLDDFWRNGAPPNMELYRAFRDYVIATTQINGDFYTRSGIPMAVAGAVQRLVSGGDVSQSPW